MEVEINLWAVLLATVSSMVVGSIWYGEVGFVKSWQKLAQVKDKKGKELQKAMISSMSVAVLTSLLMAYILAHITFILHQFYGQSFMQDALTTAFWMWLGFQGSRMFMNDTFEGRPFKLTLINAGNSLVTIMVMGFIIGALKP